LFFHGNPFSWTGAAGHRACGTVIPDYTLTSMNVYGEPAQAVMRQFRLLRPPRERRQTLVRRLGHFAARPEPPFSPV
jgi:hypothetical protein